MWPTLSEADDSVRYSLFFLANVVLTAWTYKIIAPAKVGWSRFLLALPMFVLCYLVFTLFDYERPSDRNMVVHCAAIYLWLAPWKLAGLSLKRGPLVKAYESRSLSAFIVSFLLNVNVAFEATPVAQKKKSDDSSSPTKAVTCAHDDVKFAAIKYKGKALLKELRTVIAKVTTKVLCMVFFGTLYRMKKEDSFIKNVFCIWYGYAWVSNIADTSQLISLAVLGLKLEDAFDKPYLADSFSDFWARRWNRLMGVQLRELCYEPIVQGKWIAPREYLRKKKGSLIRRLIGIFLTFLASALVHLLLFVAMFPATDFPFRFVGTFVVSPFFVGFEAALKILIQRSETATKIASKVHKFVRILFVHVSMLALAHFLFLPDLNRVGFYQKSMDSFFAMFGHSISA